MTAFLYNYNYEHYPGLEMMKYPVVGQASSYVAANGVMNKVINGYNNGDGNHHHHHRQMAKKKKRLSSEQLDSLESSFQEDIKLDPGRKMKLARGLGLQPRQVAIWFQNRRARWKAKQLEQLYDGLKLEFDAVSREKQQLQEEVLALKAMLKEVQAAMKNHQVVSTEVSGEDTVESTSVGNRSSAGKLLLSHHHHQIATADLDHQANYHVFNVDD